MATLRSDLIIPEVFTPYLIEATTQTDSFLQSGVVQPLAELNLSSTAGGDFVKIPFYKANLTGDFEVLSDSTSLTPSKIQADNQIAAVLHRGRAFSSRDLASLAVGSSTDPMAAIAQKMAAYVNNQKQKDLYSCLIAAECCRHFHADHALAMLSSCIFGCQWQLHDGMRGSGMVSAQPLAFVLVNQCSLCANNGIEYRKASSSVQPQTKTTTSTRKTIVGPGASNDFGFKRIMGR